MWPARNPDPTGVRIVSCTNRAARSLDPDMHTLRSAHGGPDCLAAPTPGPAPAGGAEPSTLSPVRSSSGDDLSAQGVQVDAGPCGGFLP